MDLGAPASPTYRDKLPFAFTGTVRSVGFELAATRPVLQ
jgi:hypothetical protein